jgi:tetratricopeptide (TPR) repeat protein
MRGLALLSVWIVTILTALAPSELQAGGIPVKKLKELKAATVFIRVQFNTLGKSLPSSGSGFVLRVDGDTALIATNHHVVSPLPGEVRKGDPKVVFNSGTPDEKTIEAQVVASDPTNDLAILKVKGAGDLPRPIRLDAANEVLETMTVFAFGFPFGEGLAFGKGNPAITITKGTVSSLRNDPGGKVKLVQIDADINPGNSGGPIVDDQGNLVGVAVLKLMKARIGFAVPVRPLEDILNGKVARVAFDTVKVENNRAVVNIEAGLLDPLGKLKDMAVYVRPAKDAQDARDLPRADKEGKVPLLQDATRVAIELKEGKGSAQFTLPAQGQEKQPIVYQAAYVNATGKTTVTPASLATLDFTQLVYAAQIAADDPKEKRRGMPHKVFTHKMQAGKHYVIEMRGDPKVIDPYLQVQDARGTVLAEDDDSGGFPNALIVFSPSRDDEYKIIATVFRPDLLGPFTLRIREETGRPVGPGLNLGAVLLDTDANDPVMNSPAHSYQLIFKKGKSYVIDMKSKDFDPYLRLENMAGLNVKNEDVGGNGHSTLVFAPAQDGIYRLVATTYDFKTGKFEVHVREGPSQYEVGPAGLNINGVLNLNDPLDIVNGKPNKARCKVYNVQLKAGQKYQIDLVSNQFDAFLRIENNRGIQLAFDDDSGGNLNARLIFAPPADGVYRVIATHFDNRLGAFNLIIRSLAPEKGAGFWFNQGVAQLKVGQLEQAIANLSKAIELEPTTPAPWNERGIAYFRQGQWEKAAADFSAAIDRAPTNPVFLTNRADALGRLGQWDKVIADLTRAIELDPAVATRWNLRGVAFYRKGQWDKAAADFSSAIERDANVPLHWTNRGDVLGKLRQWDKAIADFSKAIQLKPDYELAWLLRGSAQASLGQWDKASEDLARAGSFPRAVHKAWSDYALVRLQLKDLPGYREACARLMKAIDGPEKPNLENLAMIAWVCSVDPESEVNLGPLIQALEKQKADPSSPQYYPYLRALGSALYRAGKPQEAVKRLQDATVSRKTPTPAAWIFLAMAHHELGQKNEAKQWLAKARSWLEEQGKKDPEANQNGPLSNLPWSERLTLERTFREADNLLKNQGTK